MAAKTAVTAEH